MTPFQDADALAATIIIPAWNAARFIEGALSSACAQTERRIEVLVVDDCSTDDTADLVRAFAARDPRVRLLRTPKNGGPSAACNVGFAAARGEWIAILDADDTLEPERMERLVALGRERRADMCADNLLLVDEEGVRPSEPMLPVPASGGERRITLTAFFENNVGNSNRRTSYGFLQPMFRRAFLEQHGLRFDETKRFAEDFAFYVECLKAGAAWWMTPEPMYRYLIRKGSLTEAHGMADVDRLRDVDLALLADRALMSDPRLERSIRRHLAGLDRYRVYKPFTVALKAGQWRQAAAEFGRSSKAARLIASECLRQAPAVVSKVARQAGKRRAGAPRRRAVLAGGG